MGKAKDKGRRKGRRKDELVGSARPVALLEREDAETGPAGVMRSIDAYLRWWLVAAGCFLASIGYLYLISEVVDEPGPLRSVVHLCGLGVVVLGLVSAYRGWRAGRRMESFSAQTARQTLSREIRTGGRSVVRPATALPATIRARPRIITTYARKKSHLWVVALFMLMGLAASINEELERGFLVTFFAVLGVLVAFGGVIYLVSSRGRVVVDVDTVRVRKAFRARTYQRSRLRRAVQVTTGQYVPRAGYVESTSVHVLNDRGRRAFSFNHDAFGVGAIEEVLAALGLRLHQIPGSHDLTDLEAMVPGSTRLFERRPMATAFATVGVIVVALVLGVVLWSAFDDDDAGSGDDGQDGASATRVTYVDQNVIVNGRVRSLYEAGEEPTPGARGPGGHGIGLRSAEHPARRRLPAR